MIAKADCSFRSSHGSGNRRSNGQVIVMPNTLAFFGTTIGITEVVILAVLGLLIFGRRLPEVGRSLGKGIVEFKRGLSGIEEDIDSAGDMPPETDADASSDPTRIDAGNTENEIKTDTEPQTKAPAGPDSNSES